MATVKCEICGRYSKLELHHVFEGRNRKNSDKYGAVIRVCRTCHNNIHHYPRTYEYLKREWQKRLMERNGWSVDEFIEVFRKNYAQED